MGFFKNQYASTGTMVNETNSEATKAIAKVKANGRKISPIRPLTRAIGKKTATVVMVAAVIAPETSLTAFRTAFFFGSP